MNAPKSRRLTALKFLLRPYRWQMAGIALVILAVSGLEFLNVGALFPIFSTLLQGTEQPGPLGWLNRLALRIPLRDPIAAAVGLLMALTAVKCGVILLRDRMVAQTSGTVQMDLKNRILQRYARSHYLFFLDHKQGELIHHLSISANRVGTLAQKIPQLLSEFSSVLAVGALLFVALPAAAAVFLVVGLFYGGLTRWLSSRVSYHLGKERIAAGQAQTSVLNEFLTGIRQVMAFGVEPYWQRRFAGPNRAFRDLYVRDSFWLSVPKVLLEFVSVALLFGIILWLWSVSPQRFLQQLPLVGLFALGSLKLLPSLAMIGHLRMEVVGLAADAEVVHWVLTQPAPRPTGGSRVWGPLRKGISLEGVEFSYPGRGKTLDFSEKAPVFRAGKVTAVVGPSGSGKSTLAHLLLGLLEPTRGRVLIDDRVDLRELDLESWRRRIGFVSQELFTFHGTVAENIAFGRSECGQEQIRQAAQIANAHEFIAKMPHGYDAVVGERGMKLSGGQRQRLAIARAVLHDPEILIFDEATSFLDTESERLVQEAIERISGSRTVILIAHRLSTVQNADHLIVLEKGRVAEQGRPSDLLRAGRGRTVELFTAGSPAAPGGGR